MRAAISILRYQRRPHDNRLCWFGLYTRVLFRGRARWLFLGWRVDEPATPAPQSQVNCLPVSTDAPPETLPVLFLVSPGQEDAAQCGLRRLPITELQSAFDRILHELQELARDRRLSPSQLKHRLEARTGLTVLAAEFKKRGIPCGAHAERRRPFNDDTSDPQIVRRRKHDDQFEL